MVLRAADQANIRQNGDDPCAKTECEPLPNNFTLFVRGAGDPDEVALNDIKQGVIGDCYLMAALGAIAQRRPALIKQMITEVRDETGTVTAYKVAFYRRSRGQYRRVEYRRVEVTVDAREFPKNRAHAEVTGDRTADGADEIWPLIIEKAYAKLRGGYDVIGSSGDPGKAMSELLGTSYRNIVGSDLGKYSFADLKRDFEQGLVVPWTPDAPEGSKLHGRLRKWNLYGRHAYVVTGVTEKNGERQVLLYNPWGLDEEQPKPIPYKEFKNLFYAVSIGSLPAGAR